ncbi:hypothetical protein [Planctomycetes bacterium K23_9]|uniref:Uncharacterized protein n=1 Tax=Stieleria marina TaxID=1930275 RepID=A0A517P2B5_9BACT|nr:hypothetical protein K239x_55360 [Planctomycetes bacterium K23_9]
MSATKLSDLLPVAEGISDPHAYQVFGLDGGEQDGAKIKRAVTAVYAKLKSSKQDADPQVWKQAATLAQQAKAILADPRQRAELDARFGIVPVVSPPAGMPPVVPAGVPPTAASPAVSPPTGLPPTGLPPAAAPVADPLAGMLPPTDPMAAPAPSINPMSPVAPTQQLPPPSAGAPGAGAGAGVAGAGVAAAGIVRAASPSSPQVKVKKTKRRKKSGAGKLMFVVGMCALTALIAGLGVFMYLGRDIAISKDGKLVTQRQLPNAGPAAAQVRPTRQQRDPVMGNPAPRAEPPKTSTGLPMNQFSPPQDPMPGPMNPSLPSTNGDPVASEPIKGTDPDGPGMANPSMDNPAMDSPAMDNMPSQATMPAEVDQPAVNPDGALPVSPGTTSAPVQLTDADIAANEQEIQKVKKVIRDLNWTLMRSSAEKVTQRTLSDAQRIEADALYNLADLASYYRGGLQRGLGAIKATQDFEVTEGVRVLVVEVSPSSLTIKYNGRNRTYSVEEIPFRLAEKIASFAIDLTQPDGIASKAVFQAISPLSNEEYRKDSIEWLEMVDPDMPDVDTKEVAKQIKELF